MRLDQEHPSNKKVLDYLCRNATGWRGPFLEPATAPGGLKPRPGSHPDIVQYLWESLAPHLRAECRALVCGCPALVAPARGVIFAVPLGTEYGLRLPPPEFELARAAGAEVVHFYRTAGIELDLFQRFGPHWVFGAFDSREPEWCAAAMEFAEK